MPSSLSLASRILFHSSSPPLLFPALPELSTELYNIIALSLRAYVSPSYTKFSRYDRDFLPRLSVLLSALILNVHARIVSPAVYPHIPALVFIHLPVILTQHFHDYKSATRKLGSSYAIGGAASLPDLFALQQPHIAFRQDRTINPEYYRQVIDHILRLLLPPEEYAPDAERLLITEIILKVFLNDILPRISHPAFIYSLLLDLLGPSEEHNPIQDPPSTFSFHTLIVAVLSALQTFSTLCLTLIHHYKHTISTINLLQKQRHPDNDYAFPSLLLISEILSARSSFFLSLILTSFSMFLSLFSIPLFPNSPPILPLLLPHILLSTLSSPSFLLSTTRALKNSLFPNGYPGPPPPVPTPEQVSLQRDKLIHTICNYPKFPRFCFGPNSKSTVQQILDPLSDEDCNKRLVVFLLDRVLVTVFPELVGEQSHC